VSATVFGKGELIDFLSNAKCGDVRCRKNAPYAHKKYALTAVQIAARRQPAAPPKYDKTANFPILYRFKF
jgi:hypothetical protein